MIRNEDICYLLRKTSLTLKQIGKLSPDQFIAILNEVYLQESQEHFYNQQAVASILAAIYNTIPRKHGKAYKASDFLHGEMPQRQPQIKISIEELAESKGIKLPKEMNGS